MSFSGIDGVHAWLNTVTLMPCKSNVKCLCFMHAPVVAKRARIEVGLSGLQQLLALLEDAENLEEALGEFAGDADLSGLLEAVQKLADLL